MQKQEISHNTRELSSNQKGKHAELLAATALLANGYSVMEPISPQPYDLAVRRADGSTKYVQVKTVQERSEERYKGDWLVVKGAKNNGEVYTFEEVDFFVVVWDGNVFMFENKEQREYWCRPWEAESKWQKLSDQI